jgi:hypothetical protein
MSDIEHLFVSREERKNVPLGTLKIYERIKTKVERIREKHEAIKASINALKNEIKEGERIVNANLNNHYLHRHKVKADAIRDISYYVGQGKKLVKCSVEYNPKTDEKNDGPAETYERDPYPQYLVARGLFREERRKFSIIYFQLQEIKECLRKIKESMKAYYNTCPIYARFIDIVTNLGCADCKKNLLDALEHLE